MRGDNVANVGRRRKVVIHAGCVYVTEKCKSLVMDEKNENSNPKNNDEMISHNEPTIQCIASSSIQTFFWGEYILDHHCNMLHHYCGQYRLLPEMWTSYKIEDLVQIIGHWMMITIVHQLLHSLHRHYVYHHMQLIKYVRQWMLCRWSLEEIH